MSHWNESRIFTTKIPPTQADCPFKSKVVDDLVAGIPLPKPKEPKPKKKRIRHHRHSKHEVR